MNPDRRPTPGRKLSPVKYRAATKQMEDLLNPETLDDMTRKLLLEEVRRPELTNFNSVPYSTQNNVVPSTLSPVSSPATTSRKRRGKENDKKKAVPRLLSLRKKLANGKTLPYHPLTPPDNNPVESSRGLSVGNGAPSRGGVGGGGGGVRLQNLHSIPTLEKLAEISPTSSGSASSLPKGDLGSLPQVSQSFSGVMADPCSPTALSPHTWKSTSSPESSTQFPNPLSQPQQDIVLSLASRLRETEQLLRVYQLELQENYRKLRETREALEKAKKQNEEDEQNILSLYEAKQDVEAELRELTQFLRSQGLEWDRSENKAKAIPETLKKVVLRGGRTLGGGKRLGGDSSEKPKEEEKEKKESASKKEGEVQSEAPLPTPPSQPSSGGEQGLPLWASESGGKAPRETFPQEGFHLYQGMLPKDPLQLLNNSDGDGFLRQNGNTSTSVRAFIAQEMERKGPSLYNHQGSHGPPGIGASSTASNTEGMGGGDPTSLSSFTAKIGTIGHTSGTGSTGLPTPAEGPVSTSAPFLSLPSSSSPSSLAPGSMPAPPIDIALLQRNAQILSNYVGSKQVVTSEDGHKGCIRDREIVRVVIYKNGICVNNGPFRPFGWPLCEAFIQDLAEGYYPYEFKEKYPDGYPLEVTDRHEEECDPYNPQTSGAAFSSAGGGVSGNVLSTVRVWENDGGYQPVSQDEFLQKLPVKAISATGRLIDVRETIASILSGGEKPASCGTSAGTAVLDACRIEKPGEPGHAMRPAHHLTKAEIQMLQHETSVGVTPVPQPSSPLAIDGTPTLSLPLPSPTAKKNPKTPNLGSSSALGAGGSSSLSTVVSSDKRRGRKRTKQPTAAQAHKEMESERFPHSHYNGLPPRDASGKIMPSGNENMNAGHEGRELSVHSSRSWSTSSASQSFSGASSGSGSPSRRGRNNGISIQRTPQHPTTSAPFLPSPLVVKPLMGNPYTKKDVGSVTANPSHLGSSSTSTSATMPFTSTAASVHQHTSTTLASSQQSSLPTVNGNSSLSGAQQTPQGPPDAVGSRPQHPVPGPAPSLSSPQPPRPSVPLLSLLIRLPSGQSLTLSLSPEDTIATLREEFIAAVSPTFDEHTNFEFCRAFPPLTFSDHSKSLASYGIGNRSALLVKLIK